MRPDAASVLKAGCKVNIFLRVTGRRDDGYHTIESLFLPLALPGDAITISPRNGEGMALTCSDPELEGPGNIMFKAYNAFADAASFSPDISVFLEKNIPRGAGLGGGSSDAATLLSWLNNAASDQGLALSPEALIRLAAAIGADVPFFLLNGPAMVTGIGEIITPVANPLAGMHLVLVCPRAHVPTAWAFAAWDEISAEKHSDQNLTNTIGKDSSPFVRGICVQNDLCPVVFSRFPQLCDIRTQLHTLKADAASMSGSGASIFGLFEKKEAAYDAVCFFESAGERVFHHIL